MSISCSKCKSSSGNEEFNSWLTQSSQNMKQLNQVPDIKQLKNSHLVPQGRRDFSSLISKYYIFLPIRNMICSYDLILPRGSISVKRFDSEDNKYFTVKLSNFNGISWKISFTWFLNNGHQDQIPKFWWWFTNSNYLLALVAMTWMMITSLIGMISLQNVIQMVLMIIKRE